MRKESMLEVAMGQRASAVEVIKAQYDKFCACNNSMKHLGVVTRTAALASGLAGEELRTALAWNLTGRDVIPEAEKLYVPTSTISAKIWYICNDSPSGAIELYRKSDTQVTNREMLREAVVRGRLEHKTASAILAHIAGIGVPEDSKWEAAIADVIVKKAREVSGIDQVYMKPCKLIIEDCVASFIDNTAICNNWDRLMEIRIIDLGALTCSYNCMREWMRGCYYAKGWEYAPDEAVMLKLDICDRTLSIIEAYEARKEVERIGVV